MSRKKFTCIYLIGAALIPILLMLIVYANLKIWPFGEKSILTLDMHNQYKAYFSYYRQCILGKHDFLYTFSKTLGGDMVGLTAYYLASPLNLILLFFPVESIPVGAELITLLKLGLCGLTFSLLISQKKKSYSGWIFSTAYALMSYNIVYQSNVMWLDGILLLPLVVLGIHFIFQNRTPFLYIVTLFLAIVTNYYIGFMICIFSVLYFLYYYIFVDKREKFLNPGIIGTYTAASALAGGLAMWLVIPVVKSLEGGKAEFRLSSLLDLSPNFGWRSFLAKFFLASFDYDQHAYGTPNIYCGMITLLFVGVFFLLHKIPLKKKIGAAILLLVLFLSFYLNGPNLLWHGMNAPTGFPFRYSFVVSFLLLLFAWEGYTTCLNMSWRFCAPSFFNITALIALSAFLLSRTEIPFMTNGKYILSIVFLAASAILYFLYSTRKWNFCLGLLLLMCFSESCINGMWDLSYYEYIDTAYYQTYTRDIWNIVRSVTDEDPAFYRMEKTFSRKMSEPMLFDFNGLSHYSSTEKNFVKEFMGQAGFRNHGNWSYYNRGSTYAMDSLLGVKYLLSSTPLGAPYELINEMNGIFIYRNLYALPIGFMSSENIKNFSSSMEHKFEMQNELWRSLAPEIGEDIFKEQPIKKVTLRNLTESPDGDGYFYPIDTTKKSSITYTFIAETDNPVFLFLPTIEMKTVDVEVNGVPVGQYFHSYIYDILRLGSFTKGEKVKIKLILKRNRYVNITDTWLYYQDQETFSKYFSALSAGGISLTKITDSRLEGTFSSVDEKQYAFFTIPYEKSWHVYIDGREADTFMSADTFLTVEVPAGEHEIRLRYIPEGSIPGLLLTGISLLFSGAWLLAAAPKNRKAVIG